MSTIIDPFGMIVASLRTPSSELQREMREVTVAGRSSATKILLIPRPLQKSKLRNGVGGSTATYEYLAHLTQR